MTKITFTAVAIPHFRTTIVKPCRIIPFSPHKQQPTQHWPGSLHFPVIVGSSARGSMQRPRSEGRRPDSHSQSRPSLVTRSLQFGTGDHGGRNQGSDLSQPRRPNTTPVHFLSLSFTFSPTLTVSRHFWWPVLYYRSLASRDFCQPLVKARHKIGIVHDNRWHCLRQR